MNEKAFIQEKTNVPEKKKDDCSLKKHMCSANKHEDDTFLENIHRIGFLYPKTKFSPKICIGTDISIRDLVDSRGRKTPSTFPELYKVIFPRFGKSCNKFFPKSVGDLFPYFFSIICPLLFYLFLDLFCSQHFLDAYFLVSVC